MLVSLTVGKVDAGVAVLLTEDKRLVSIVQSNAGRAHGNVDRIPLNTATSFYHLRLYSRHHSRSEPES